MQFKTSLELLLDNIGPREAKLALSKSTPNLAREGYINQIKGYEKSIKIITGEADNQLFDRKDFKQALREGFSCKKDKTVQFVFHKNDDMETAKEQFQVQNEELVKLKLRFPDRVHIYWSPIRPRQHYLVVDDGERAVLEEPNHAGGESFWATVVLDRNRATSWAKRFDDYVKYCTELNFESSSRKPA